jgi:hypothetical protein
MCGVEGTIWDDATGAYQTYDNTAKELLYYPNMNAQFRDSMSPLTGKFGFSGVCVDECPDRGDITVYDDANVTAGGSDSLSQLPLPTPSHPSSQQHTTPRICSSDAWMTIHGGRSQPSSATDGLTGPVWSTKGMALASSTWMCITQATIDSALSEWTTGYPLHRCKHPAPNAMLYCFQAQSVPPHPLCHVGPQIHQERPQR